MNHTSKKRLREPYRIEQKPSSMKSLITLLPLTLCVLSFVLMMIGFYKPYLIVWWEDIQNRRKVLKVYGGSTVLFFIIYLISKIWLV